MSFDRPGPAIVVAAHEVDAQELTTHVFDLCEPLDPAPRDP